MAYEILAFRQQGNSSGNSQVGQNFGTTPKPTITVITVHGVDYVTTTNQRCGSLLKYNVEYFVLSAETLSEMIEQVMELTNGYCDWNFATPKKSKFRVGTDSDIYYYDKILGQYRWLCPYAQTVVVDGIVYRKTVPPNSCAKPLHSLPLYLADQY